ncbi:MAG: hypothetical protein AAF902_11610, partial [Chloroflexota bacterium]
LISLLFVIVLMGPAASAANHPISFNENVYEVDIQINRSAVPALYFNDLTLKTYVGSPIQAYVSADGGQIDSVLSSGHLVYSTSADQVKITVAVPSGETLPQGFGATTKTVLKDNKQWAWSHGFDDNTYLFAGMELFEQKGWRGTIYLIGELLDERDEYWRVDLPAARRALENGWSLGSHSWGSQCDDPNQSAVKRSFDKLEEIVASTTRNDYVVTAFAAPCFVSEYHPVVMDMRNNGITNVQFNESGGWHFQITETNAPAFQNGNHTALGVNFDEPIGRDFGIEYLGITEMKFRIDWAASNSNSSRHIWYNTGAHGSQEDDIAPVLDYVFDTYGPNAANTVWVAPADEIYGYILVRDFSVVTVGTAQIVSGVIASQTPTMTSTVPPIASNTPLPTSTPFPPLPPSAQNELIFITMVMVE